MGRGRELISRVARLARPDCARVAARRTQRARRVSGLGSGFSSSGLCEIKSGDAPLERALTPPSPSSSPIPEQKKKWEKQALNKNGNPVRHSARQDERQGCRHRGADKGKVTEVVEVFTKSGEILCKDVNIKTKHVKPKGEGETGQIIQKEWPIHHSNVMHWSEDKKGAQHASVTRWRVTRRFAS